MKSTNLLHVSASLLLTTATLTGCGHDTDLAKPENPTQSPTLTQTQAPASTPVASTPAPAISSTPAPAPAPTFTAEQYNPIFEAAVQTLRDMRFTVDRTDHRFGVVTTKPLVASSIFEFWYEDNASIDQAWASSINLRRRTVRVQLEPLSDSDSDSSSSTYALNVEVLIEQRQDPTRQLYTSAVRSASISRSAERRYSFRSERGVESAFWRTIGRDASLEHRLAQRIFNQAATPAATDTAQNQSAAAN